MTLEGSDLEYFLKCCKEVGAKVTPVKPGEKGKITINGEPIDWDKVWERFEKGIQKAVAYENGEIECITETREDGKK